MLTLPFFVKFLFNDGSATTTFRGILSVPNNSSEIYSDDGFSFSGFFCAYSRYSIEGITFLLFLNFCEQNVKINKLMSEYLSTLIDV